MRNEAADASPRPGPAGETVRDRWEQRSGFSVFFDIQLDGPGRRTRIYHEETGAETTLTSFEPTAWVSWMLERLRSTQPPAAAAASI
jgi:hypothetical protein